MLKKDYLRRAAVLFIVFAMVLLRPARTTTLEGTDWNVGDVFVGLGDPGGYAAYLQDDPATPELVEVADNPATPQNEMDLFRLLGTYRVFGQDGAFREDVNMPTAGITTGCAVNLATGQLWATSFGDRRVEAVSAIHDGASGHAPVSSIDVASLASNPPGVAAVESIAFDRSGNFFVGVPDEDEDFDYDLNADEHDGFGTIVKFSPSGVRIAEYRVPVNLYPDGYTPAANDQRPRGVDWMDLSADGKTLFYTSEDRFIRTLAFDTKPQRPGDQPGAGPGNALVVRGATYPATPGVWGYINEVDARAYALRLLPPGDGSGGLLVAGPSGIYRLSATGRQVMFTKAENASKFFAINLSPDARFVWTATQLGTPAVFKFHVATGQLMPLGTSDRLPMPAPVNGLCVKLEYTSQSVDCTATPGNPLCQRIELCTADSPGDDDGDGLADDADADCDIPGAVEICGNRRDDDRNGLVDEICPRANTESDTVAVGFESRPPGEVRSYTAMNLPDGLTIDSATGVVSGTLSYASAGVHQVTVRVNRTTSGGLRTATGTFPWTVVDKNGPPVIELRDQVSDERTFVSYVVPLATDPDGDPVAQGVPGPRPDGLQYNATTHTLSGTLADVPADTTTTLFFELRDGHGNDSTVTFRWTVRDANGRPLVTVPPDQVNDEGTPVSLVIPAAIDPAGGAMTYAVAGLPAGLVFNPATREISGTLADVPVGGVSATVTITVVGSNASTSSLSFLWRVNDVNHSPTNEAPNHAPVCTGATLTGGDLWPPDHRLVAFQITGVTDEDMDPIRMAITSITQNEPTNTKGDGNTAIDGVIDGATAWLRAERDATASSRVYRVGFTASDGHATCTGSVTAQVVPHDQGKSSPPAVSMWYDSTAAPAPPAKIK